MSVSEEGFGVIFDEKNYAGFFTRVIIAVVDLIVIVVVISATLFITKYLIDDHDIFYYFNMIFFISFWIWYLALLKRSKFRTIGYMLTGVKIVNLRGEKPSIFKMVLRAFLNIIGPFQVFIDFIWLSQETTKQTLRDKYIGTYVIKRNATPVGRGRLQLVILGLMGWSIMYREVKESLTK